jgi:hypothetical protein
MGVLQLAQAAGCEAEYAVDDAARRRRVLPRRLLARAFEAFMAGDLGVGPVAELRGESDEQFLGWAEENLGVRR